MILVLIYNDSRITLHEGVNTVLSSADDDNIEVMLTEGDSFDVAVSQLKHWAVKTDMGATVLEIELGAPKEFVPSKHMPIQ